MEEDDADENGGLFAIEVSSEDEATQSQNKVPRDFQSEAEFERIRVSYKPKIEIGELWKSLTLPIHNPGKVEIQKILHAIEELYFFRRYEEALQVTRQALEGDLGNEFKKTLENYERRCQARMLKAENRTEKKT